MSHLAWIFNPNIWLFSKLSSDRNSQLQVANWKMVACQQQSALPVYLPSIVLSPASSLFGFFKDWVTAKNHSMQINHWAVSSFPIHYIETFAWFFRRKNSSAQGFSELETNYNLKQWELPQCLFLPQPAPGSSTQHPASRVYATSLLRLRLNTGYDPSEDLLPSLRRPPPKPHGWNCRVPPSSGNEDGLQSHVELPHTFITRFIHFRGAWSAIDLYRHDPMARKMLLYTYIYIWASMYMCI